MSNLQIDLNRDIHQLAEKDQHGHCSIMYKFVSLKGICSKS